MSKDNNIESKVISAYASIFNKWIEKNDAAKPNTEFKIPFAPFGMQLVSEVQGGQYQDMDLKLVPAISKQLIKNYSLEIKDLGYSGLKEIYTINADNKHFYEAIFTPKQK